MSIDQLGSEINKIDINQKDGLEKKEIDDFLSKEEDVKKLGEIMVNLFDIQSETLSEFKDSISKICERVIKGDIDTNKGKILAFYLKHFYDKNDKLSKKITKKALEGSWYQQVSTEVSLRDFRQDMEDFRREIEQERQNELFKNAREEQERQEQDRERCFKLLESRDPLSADDIQWLKEYKESAGIYLVKRDKDRIEERLRLEEMDNDITQETIELTSNSQLENLDAIDEKIKNEIPNWENLMKDIKTYEDIGKISTDNIDRYLKIPEGIDKEGKYYIVSNFQKIIGKHLCLHQGYKLGRGLKPNETFATGMKVKDIVDENKLLENAYKELESLKTNKGKTAEKIKYIFSKNNHILFDFWLKQELQKYKNNNVKLGEFTYNTFSIANNVNKNILTNFSKKNSFIKEILGNYNDIIANRTKEQKEQDLIKQAKIVNIPQELINGYLNGQNKYKKVQLFTKEQLRDLKQYYNTGLDNFDKLFKVSQDFWYGNNNYPKKLGLPNCLDIEEYFKFECLLKRMSDYIQSTEIRFRDQTNVIRPARSASPNYDKLKKEKEEKQLDAMSQVAEEYVKLWKRSGGNYRPKSFLGFSLKWTNISGNKRIDPKEIVRDSSREKIYDSFDNFLTNIKNDRQKAFGDMMGLIGGCTWAVCTSASGYGSLATGAAYELGSRVRNGISQEAWNLGEMGLQALGQFEDDGNNRVDDLGDSFLLGFGLKKRNENGDPEWRSGGEIASDLIFSTTASVISFKFINLNKLNSFSNSYLFAGINNFLAKPSLNIVEAGVGAGIGFGEYQNYSVGVAMGEQFLRETSGEGITQKLVNTMMVGGIIGRLGNVISGPGKKFFKGFDCSFLGKLNEYKILIGNYLKNNKLSIKGDSLYDTSGKLVKKIEDKTFSNLLTNYVSNLQLGWQKISVVLTSPLVVYNLLSEDASPMTILNRRMIAVRNKLNNTGDGVEHDRYVELLERYQNIQNWIQKNGIDDDGLNNTNVDDIEQDKIDGEIAQDVNELTRG